MSETKRRGPKHVTDEHKVAMAVGRSEGRAVRAYLEALDANRPKRGRKRTAESIQKRLLAIDDEVAAADALTRVNLIQERMDLHDEAANLSQAVDLSMLEAEFVASAKNYSERRGISYAAWREAGVDANVLKRADISR